MPIVPVNSGSQNLSAQASLRRGLSPAYRGREVDAILHAIGASEQKVQALAAAAFDQLFRSTASGTFLERKMSDYGISKPDQVGLSDDLFRRLGIKYAAQKLTAQSLADVLEVFYGSDSTRASLTTSVGEPYALADGQTLQLLVDERASYPLLFSAGDFASVGAATAVEVSFSVTRQLRQAGSEAYAVVWFDVDGGVNKVRVYSPSLGLRGAVRATGGSAQNALQFPSVLPTLSDVPPVPGVQVGQSWVVSVPEAGTARYTLSGGTNVDLTKVRVGDYANVFGAAFSPSNQGSFPVTAVDVRYVGGTTLTQYFEVANSAATPQTVTTVAAEDILFFRPTRGTIAAAQQAVVVVSQPSASGGVVLLPATSTAVSRKPPYAAYLHQQPVQVPTGIERVGTTVTVTTSTPHGVRAGQWVWLDDAWGSDAQPPTATGNSSLTDGSALTSWDLLRTSSGSTSVALEGARGAQLLSGNALVCGGRNLTGGAHYAQTRAVLFGVTGTTTNPDGSVQYGYSWTVATPMPVGREFHGAVGLVDSQQGGNALALGGYNTGTATALSDSYVYSVGGNSWSATLPMVAARAAPGVALLRDARVLAVGGGAGSSALASAEVFTPSGSGGSWAPVAAMSTGRVAPVAVALSTGRVLVAGGAAIPGGSSLSNVLNLSGPTTPLASAEVWDPTTNTWTTTGPMAYSRTWAAAVLLPGDQVLVVGGYGAEACSSASAAQLSSCEVWDSATGRWARCDPLPETAPASVDGSLFAAWHPQSQRALVVTQVGAYWFDPTTRRWSKPVNWQQLSPARSRSCNVLLGVGAVLSAEGDVSGSTTNSSYVFVPNSDFVSRGDLVGLRQVVSVPDPNTLTYSTPDTAGYTLNANDVSISSLLSLGFPLSFPIQLGRAEVAAVVNGLLSAAQMFPASAVPSGAGQPGPYTLDPTDGVALGSVSTTSAATLYAGHGYKSLPVATGGATAFPDEPGYLVLGFGQSYEVGPVRYLGLVSDSELALDYSFELPVDVPSGADVTLLTGPSPFDPAPGQQLGYLRATASNSGRVAAQSFVEGAIATGLGATVEVVYPGDRGLGNEGQPDSGVTKVSDQVEVWGSDDVDSDVAAARGT